ncbi:TolC family protein [Bacteroides helcogenes]|uniref:Outer membrane efflux protein n=1 Tax=Bacteroides helcogenes (strain ATCC 35417 / DSM 20613 / JCM 6297 / CCUG 15421 / P 36-108) TaxID=693979 RepID=E6SWW7_BACT6|nr:TolC family protein [Bacteroides helcogenes]ADV44655.1 outer membrane efflux protein [Bacteroides helcogenes P 36-108]MDY5238948.1 TolC family protein [Bacteroides helcogenes]
MDNVRRLTVITLCMASCAWLPAQTRTDVQQATAETILHTDSLPAQWNLQACIDYAIKQNISIRKNRLSAQSAEVDVKTAKAALFPSLSASVSQRIVNRPQSETNTIINGDNITSSQSKTSYNGSYGIDANWTLYNGGKRLNTIKQQELNNRIAQLSVSQSENNIEQSIAQTYVQILYAAEAVKINESTLKVSQAECERSRQLLKEGSIARSDLAQLEAQVSSDKYQFVTAQATLQDYKLQLKQLLELDGEEEMNLYIPALGTENVLSPLPSKMDVYQSALTLRPEIEEGKLNVQASELNIKIARAGYMPTLSLSAGIGTSHSNGSDYTFSEQIKQNWNNSLGFTVSVPIFSNRQTKSAVEKAKIQKQTSELNLLDEQKTLYKTIESLWLDANSAQQSYAAAKEKLKSTQTSYDLIQEQFNLGMKNTVELLTEKSNLLNAQQAMLQAKYMAILNMQLLKFYQGENIEL